jgi:hypothetical protein
MDSSGGGMDGMVGDFHAVQNLVELYSADGYPLS